MKKIILSLIVCSVGFINFSYGFSVSDSIDNFWSYLLDHTIIGNILSFIWGIISFIFYSVRSILYLVWNILYTLINGFTNLFVQITSTFQDLSLFMGQTTSILFSLFSLVLLIIVCGFLFRFFIGKFHYNTHIKGK